MGITKQLLYKRQTSLAEIGEEGQQKIMNAKIVIIGCGGLGSVAAVYLAASGIGKIHLIDYDTVDISNLHRQVFYKIKDVGKSKADVLANHIHEITPFVDVTTSNKPITKNNIFDQINNFDVVLDCTDNLETKYLLNDYCVITDHILVYGSLYKNDGYVASFNIPEGPNNSANLRNAFPEIPTETIPNCAQIGTLNPIVGIIGLMQANEVLKIITHIGQPLKNQILIINSLDNSQFKMKLKGDKTLDNFRKKEILEIFKKSDYLTSSCVVQEDQYLISSEELKLNINAKNLVIISVIEETNTPLPFEVYKKIPLSKLEIKKLPINRNKKYVFICNKGILSYTATQMLKKEFPELNVLSLKNGITKY